jgi:hypothetical protein
LEQSSDEGVLGYQVAEIAAASAAGADVTEEGGAS